MFLTKKNLSFLTKKKKVLNYLSLFYYSQSFFLINNKILLKRKTDYKTLHRGIQNPTERAEKMTFVTVKDPTKRAEKQQQLQQQRTTKITTTSQ